MSKLRRGRAQALVVALWLGAFLLLSCQPAQPVATPKPAEKAAEKPAATAKPAEKATEKPAATAKPAEKATEKPVRGGTLRMSYFADMVTLDPHLATAQHAYNSLFDALIQPDVDGNLTKEGLFKDWTIGGDGKSITFKLQGGVKFHDGTDLDAAAVKWNIERMKDPATKSTWASSYASVASVEVVDGLTVRFNLKQPDPILLPSMTTQAGFMVSPAAVKKYGVDFGRNPVGSGPFQFVEWAAGDHFTYKRFDGYWGKDKAGNQLPYLDRVVFQIIPDTAVAFANLRTGQTDVYRLSAAGLPLEQLPILKADANLTYLVQVPSAINGAVNINTKKPPFDNKALRQAVALAIDREGMAARLGEMAKVQASIFTSINWGNDGKAGVYPARDLAKAKAKMAEAGYPSGGLKVKYVSRNEPTRLADSQIIKANLAEIGIELELEVLALPAYISKVNVAGPQDYQIATGNTSNGLPDPGQIWSLHFHSQGGRNFWGPYNNPQVDQLLDKAGSIYDQGERDALYRQAANIIADDMPIVPLYVLNFTTPMNKEVRDYPRSVTDSIGYGRTWLAK